MKNIYRFALVIVLFLSVKTMNSQMGCLTPSLGVYDATTYSPISAIVACTYSNIIYISPTQYAVGNNGTGPCMRIIVGLTNANAATNNSIAIGQGTYNPYYNMCSLGCNTVLPNSSSYTLSLFGLDPTQNHGYNLCNTNAATNMNYTIASCYNSIPLASGIWTNTTAGACQTVNIPANSPIGIVGYTISPAVVPTASLNINTSDLYLDPTLMAQGIYTITYSFNSQNVCSTVTTRTISITNPYSANWTAISPLCSNAACVNLNPQITGTPGGTFTAASGVTSNSFCPALSGAGTFPVTYTVGLSPGCGRTATNNVVVNPAPAATAISSGSITCVSNIINLSTNPAGMTYTWTAPAGSSIVGGMNSQNALGAGPGTYSVLVQSPLNGCASMATVAAVTNTTAPIITIGTTNTLICIPQSATLTASGANTYTWSTSANTQTIAISPTVTTSYTVVGTGVNGCTNTATFTQSVSTCAGLNELSSNNEINIFPNPTSGQFTLLFDKVKEKVEVKVVNAIGQIVLRKTISSTDKINLNISDQASGVYFVEVNAGGESYRTKVVKE